ncbi:MAG: hypothetical protein K8R68_04195 [Bacteroidales bacterium]|nr:hypothetical protein [Bacteroidales bacterium]
MELSLLDWIIVSVFFVAVIGLASYTRRYNRSVSDFLAAGRCAGKYLLSTSDGMANNLSVIGLIAVWEMYYKSGFANIWWLSLCMLPVGFVLACSGFIVYRYRKSKALTLAQLFEIRYSKSFRIFSGSTCFLSGILNFAIFPSIATRFFIQFCGIPENFIIGTISIDSFLVVMFFLISIAVFLTYNGGQIAIVLTDFFQGLFCNFAIIIIIIFVLFFVVNWNDFAEVVLVVPDNASLVNPFKTKRVDDFNLAYFMILIMGNVYGYMTWQGAQGYNCSAKTPHDARMSKILGAWRSHGLVLLMLLLPLASYTVMHHSNYIDIAANINNSLSNIDNPNIREQMIVPICMAKLLPMGLKGILCAVLMAAFISTHDTYLHSWASIFLQDVVMPFKKKPFEPKTHMKVLRYSIIGVAAFICIFSYFYRPTDAILMYTALTGAIYIGGAGAVLIGGLYWKWGTTKGAFGAMIVGSVIGLTGLLLRFIWPHYHNGNGFPINGQWIYAITMFTSCLTYIILSLIERKPFDFNKLYDRDSNLQKETDSAEKQKSRNIFHILAMKMGLNKDFNRVDKVILYASLLRTIIYFSIFITGVIATIFIGIPDTTWLGFWIIYIKISFVITVIVTIWFTIGGIKDVIYMLKTLNTIKRDDTDDGFICSQNNDT